MFNRRNNFWSTVCLAPEGAEGGTAELEPDVSALTGGEGETPAAPAAGGEAAPVFDFDALTLPEGVYITDSDRETFGAIFANEELSRQDLAQQLAEVYSAKLSEVVQAQQIAGLEAWQALNKEWSEQLAELPEFKGKPAGELGSVKQVLVSLGADDKFFAAMDLTGAGNNPVIVQMLHKLTRPFVEGGAVGGGAASGPQRSVAGMMYPTMVTKE